MGSYHNSPIGTIVAETAINLKKSGALDIEGFIWFGYGQFPQALRT